MRSAARAAGVVSAAGGDPYCESVRDFVSRDLFSAILKDEEEQVDFIETQLELMTKIGRENYIHLQSERAD